MTKEQNTMRIYEHIKHVCDNMSDEQIAEVKAMLSDYIAHDEAQKRAAIINSPDEGKAEAAYCARYYGCESDYID